MTISSFTSVYKRLLGHDSLEASTDHYNHVKRLLKQQKLNLVIKSSITKLWIHLMYHAHAVKASQELNIMPTGITF